jgi:hypothetical protein
VQLQLAPVGLDELAKRLLVAGPGTGQGGLAHRRHPPTSHPPRTGPFLPVAVS